MPLSPAKRALTNGSTSSENARGSSIDFLILGSESPAVMVCDVRISVVQETEMTSMLEQCAESPPPTINIASKPRKLSHRAEGIVNSSTGESLEVESVPRKISGGKKNENPIKEESAPEVKARKEPPVPASRTNPTPVPDHGKSAKIDMAELKRKQNVEPIKEEPKPAVPIVPKTESASAKKLAAFAPKEPVVAPKDSAVSAKSDQNATTKSSEPPLAAKPSRTAAAAAAVGDVLSANMVSGPRKPPPGGVAMFDIGAMKKAQIEDPEEEELTSPKVHGHRKEPSGVPGGIRMVMPDLANHKLKSVGMLDGPESDTGKNSLKPDNLAPKPGAKGPPLAAKPSFSQAKSAAGSTVPRADAAKEDEQAEKIPPWKAELEKRKNFQPAT